MTSKYYLLALANEIEGTPLRLYADAFRNSGAKIETQAARIAELEKDLEGAKEDRDELQAVFNKCWKADQGAIKAWQEAHPGNDLVWPDRTKMVVWLLEKENAASARIAELEAALEGMAAWVAEWTDHVGDCSHKNETCSCGRAFNLHKARHALIEKPIMSSMSTKPMENINEQQD